MTLFLLNPLWWFWLRVLMPSICKNYKIQHCKKKKKRYFSKIFGWIMVVFKSFPELSKMPSRQIQKWNLRCELYCSRSASHHLQNTGHGMSFLFEALTEDFIVLLHSLSETTLCEIVFFLWNILHVVENDCLSWCNLNIAHIHTPFSVCYYHYCHCY